MNFKQDARSRITFKDMWKPNLIILAFFPIHAKNGHFSYS